MANTKITNPELFNLGGSTSATQLPVMTTIERIAMSNPSIGETIFNSTTDKVEYFDGTKWYGITYFSPPSLDILIVAGGGAATDLAGPGGGGAGGLLEGTLTAYPSAGTQFNIQVGKGGNPSTGTAYSGTNTSGDNSFVGSYIAIGGGKSAGACRISSFAPFPQSGASGGSGGAGGGYGGNNSQSTGGSSSQTDVSPLIGYGNPGGNGGNPGGNTYVGAGGGGAGTAGGNAIGSNTRSVAGVGKISTIINPSIATSNSVGQVVGTDVYFAGGGAGGGSPSVGNPGGKGGGGSYGNDGTANSGGGGGGGQNAILPTSRGGSGVIIIKYPLNNTISVSGVSGLTHTIDTSTGQNISIFKNSSNTTTGTATITF